MANIRVFNKQNKVYYNSKILENVCVKLYTYLINNYRIYISKFRNIDVTFAEEKEIISLHFYFFNQRSSTDVMSFVTEDICDIIVSIKKAKKYTENNDIVLEQEIFRYIVHGILHHCGFDDTSKKKQKRMLKEQEMIISKLWMN